MFMERMKDPCNVFLTQLKEASGELLMKNGPPLFVSCVFKLSFKRRFPHQPWGWLSMNIFG